MNRTEMGRSRTALARILHEAFCCERHRHGIFVLGRKIVIKRGEALRMLLALLLMGPLACSCTSSSRDAMDAQQEEERHPVEMTAEVSRAEAGISDPITFRVTLDTEPELSVSLPETGSLIQGLRIVDFGTEGPRLKEGRRWTQQWFKLQADLVGSYLLPSLKVSYTDEEGVERFVETPQVFVEIKSSLDPESGEKDIRDIKELERIKREIPLAWILLASLGFLLAGCVMGLVVWRRKRKRGEEILLPPEELAIRELRELESTGILEEERYREYVFHLSIILRRYLERRTGIHAVEQTTEEILGSLHKASLLQDVQKREVRSFLEETDPIKYRGLDPENEETGTIRVHLLSFLEQAAQRAEDSEEQHESVSSVT